MKTDADISIEIAQTITKQIGMINLAASAWHKAMALPAYTDGIRGGVTAKIGHAATSKYLTITIRLNALDLYDVEVSKKSGEIVKEYFHVYADQLGDLVADLSEIA
jgi:hypothetical protein